MSSNEIKLATFLIGGLELIWATVLFWSATSRISMMLDLYKMKEVFSVVMAATGVMLLLGAVCPLRKLRHVGLWMTPMICFPTFGLLITNNMTGALSFSLPFIGIMALVVLFLDSMRKPRRAKMDN